MRAWGETDENSCARIAVGRGGAGTNAPDALLAVCLGKFDAMHAGHFALAKRAAALGEPWLVSFSGMARTLGWEEKLPITAPSDRARVLNLWSAALGGEGASGSEGASGVAIREHSLPFAAVREKSPEEFVDMLVRDLGVRAIVTGENYRFGYKAAGDVAALKEFGAKNDAKVDVVELVPAARPDATLGDQVSSTRIRAALMRGDVKSANDMLGREHRLVCDVSGAAAQNALRVALAGDGEDVLLSLENVENVPPMDGQYRVRIVVDPESGDTSLKNAKDTTVSLSYGRVAVNKYDVFDIQFARNAVAIDFIDRSSKSYANGVSGRW
jgi:FAD synthetase